MSPVSNFSVKNSNHSSKATDSMQSRSAERVLRTANPATASQRLAAAGSKDLRHPPVQLLKPAEVNGIQSGNINLDVKIKLQEMIRTWKSLSEADQEEIALRVTMFLKKEKKLPKMSREAIYATIRTSGYLEPSVREIPKFFCLNFNIQNQTAISPKQVLKFLENAKASF